MICVKGHTVPDSHMVCPACTAQAGAEGFRGLQAEFLRKAAKGEWSYSLRVAFRVAKDDPRHVLMYLSPTRTFCGRELEQRPQIKYEHYNEETLAKVCAGCRMEIASIMREVAP
jgi:hypothetical protein